MDAPGSGPRKRIMRPAPGQGKQEFVFVYRGLGFKKTEFLAKKVIVYGSYRLSPSGEEKPGDPH